MKKISLTILAIFCCQFAYLQTLPQKKTASFTTNANASNSSNNPGPKPYSEIITANAKTKIGLFTVHYVENKVYFEIQDSLLGRDVLILSRLSKAGTDMRDGGASMKGYAGDELNKSIVRFEIGPNNKLFMRELSFSERSKDSTREMYRSLKNSSVQPIALSLDIKAYHKDSVTKEKSLVVDMTELLNSDNDIFFFGSSKSAFKIGNYSPDRSYLESIKTFPINTEIKTVKTYAKVPANKPGTQPSAPTPAEPVTVEVNTSLLLLPKVPMEARYADDRVGYFTNSYMDFDEDPQSVKKQSIIARWRLEPKPGDIEKYKRGELVEPQKPIIIYIDPATPAKWVPYLIQGINDWQAAFEKAGFKNAIIGKKAPSPQEDSTWSLDDARHSALVYKPSTVANASGPHTSDPRSGEILETHINWYHNVMKLLHDWYMIQAGAIDPRARKMEFDDELMGQLIRFVSSHEVGHTLGLLHNFGSSSGTPVEKLRDKAWVEEHGHTASIMDYARFNYVAQPEDHISEKGIFPRIGDYDKWAIEWGYKLIPEAKTAKEEIPILNKWVVDKLKDKRYWFGRENNPEDPRCQNEDLGDDAMKASTYGIANLKRVLANLPEWTKEKNEGYDDLADMYNQLLSQFGRYIGHVSKNIGGRYETLKTVEQPGKVYEPVPAVTQKEAMAFLNKNVFATPTWVLDKNILGLTGIDPVMTIANIQNIAINRILSVNILSNLLSSSATDPDSYGIFSFFNELQKGIWGELNNGIAIDIYRRNLQKNYIDRLGKILNPPASTGGLTMSRTSSRSQSFGNTDATNTDIISVVRANLKSIERQIKTIMPRETDQMTKYHLQDIQSRIENILKPPIGS